MRLPFIGKVNEPVIDPERDHVGAALAQMIAAELPRAAAGRRAINNSQAEQAQRQRNEDKYVAALMQQQFAEGD